MSIKIAHKTPFKLIIFGVYLLMFTVIIPLITILVIHSSANFFVTSLVNKTLSIILGLLLLGNSILARISWNNNSPEAFMFFAYLELLLLIAMISSFVAFSALLLFMAGSVIMAIIFIVIGFFYWHRIPKDGKKAASPYNKKIANRLIPFLNILILVIISLNSPWYIICSIFPLSALGSLAVTTLQFKRKTRLLLLKSNPKIAMGISTGLFTLSVSLIVLTLYGYFTWSVIYGLVPVCTLGFLISLTLGILQWRYQKKPKILDKNKFESKPLQQFFQTQYLDGYLLDMIDYDFLTTENLQLTCSGANTFFKQYKSNSNSEVPLDRIVSNFDDILKDLITEFYTYKDFFIPKIQIEKEFEEIKKLEKNNEENISAIKNLEEKLLIKEGWLKSELTEYLNQLLATNNYINKVLEVLNKFTIEEIAPYVKWILKFYDLPENSIETYCALILAILKTKEKKIFSATEIDQAIAEVYKPEKPYDEYQAMAINKKMDQHKNDYFLNKRNKSMSIADMESAIFTILAGDNLSAIEIRALITEIKQLLGKNKESYSYRELYQALAIVAKEDDIIQLQLLRKLYEEKPESHYSQDDIKNRINIINKNKIQKKTTGDTLVVKDIDNIRAQEVIYLGRILYWMKQNKRNTIAQTALNKYIDEKIYENKSNAEILRLSLGDNIFSDYNYILAKRLETKISHYNYHVPPKKLQLFLNNVTKLEEKINNLLNELERKKEKLTRNPQRDESVMNLFVGNLIKLARLSRYCKVLIVEIQHSQYLANQNAQNKDDPIEEKIDNNNDNLNLLNIRN